MLGHHRRTNAEIVHNPHLPSGWRRDGPMALSLLLAIRKGMAGSSLRALDTVALATNVAVFTFQCTKQPTLGALRLIKTAPGGTHGDLACSLCFMAGVDKDSTSLL